MVVYYWYFSGYGISLMHAVISESNRSLSGKSDVLDIARVKGTLANTILQGKVRAKRLRGRPARQWLDDVKE